MESNLSKLINSDLAEDCILLDEISALYELCRDECVLRLASYTRNGSEVDSVGQ
ncbi:MAG: hypothetical protein LIO40_05365 [Ruminococcus sp.]|nr:hypothetical protein [Ruminococcus sp.]